MMKHKRYLYFTIVILFALLAVVGLTQVFARQAQNADTGWQQVNTDGFGDPNNTDGVPIVFNDELYATSYNSSTGAQILRYTGSLTWTEVITDGFGNSDNPWISSAEVFSNTFYVSTNADEIWRSVDGNAWSQASSGFGDPENGWIPDFEVYEGYLYAGVKNDSGGQVWRSANGTDWSQVNTAGFGEDNWGVYSFAPLDGNLYAGTAGGSIWRSPNGIDWTEVITDAFGDINNDTIYEMISFSSYLYAATNNNVTGTEIWRTPDGTNWAQVNADGFGDANNRGTRSLLVYHGALYAGLRNDVDGAAIWTSQDGTTWGSASLKGFGDGDNTVMWGMAAYEGDLYAGTQNGSGGQVWRYDPTYQIFLPGIMNKYIPPSTGTWRVYNSPTSRALKSVSMVSSNDGWAGGYDGALLHYDGNQWTQFPNQSTINIQAISMSSSDNGWAVGYYSGTNQKLVLRWDGNSWNHVVIPSDFRFAQDLSTLDDVSAFFVGATLICDPDCDDIGGLINWWNGSGWVQYNTLDTHLAHWAVSMVSAADGWSVGQEKLLPSGTTQGLILRWNGSDWTRVSHPAVGLLAEVDASDAANAWAMGDFGELLHWDGINWTSVASPVSTRMYSLSIVNDQNAWAVGSESIIHFDGNEWTQVSNPTNEWLYSVSMVSRNDGWAVGYNGTILRYSP